LPKWLPWLGLVVVLAGALVLGNSRQHHATSLEAHVRRIAADVKCPTCQGLSAAESDASASTAIRDEIRSRLQQGQRDGEIRAYLVSRFGRDILLKPPATGISSLVWILPVALFVCAVAGLAFAFRRWRARSGLIATADDRALVEQALHTS
jgi:cytochrome c-type biogenesis protein CcmH